jgi:hypothetical protein
MKRVPIRKVRPGTRRGQPTPAEKEAVRRMAYERARGMCELRLEGCMRGPLPWAGPVWVRGHLVHLRSKRVHGWGAENVCWGCPKCHLDGMHVKGLFVGKTYAELIARGGVATP